MKRTIALLSSLIMVLSLCACGGNAQKGESKEEMLENAETFLADEITLDIAGNKARAQSYEGKTLRITGHILDIEEDYCSVIARTVDGDSHTFLHSDDWYGFNCDIAFLVYLPSEDLANLNLCDGIQFVGVVDEVGTRQDHAIEDQIYLKFKNAYYIKTVDYEGTYRL